MQSSDNQNPMLVKKECKVYGYDIDVMGIVSNIVYVRWMEDLRTKFLDKYFPLEEMLKINGAPIIAKAEIEYKYPTTIYDKIVGEAWVSGMGKSKWEMEFKFYTEKRVHCIARQYGYYFDLNRNKPARLPENLVNKYEKELG